MDPSHPRYYPSTSTSEEAAHPRHNSLTSIHSNGSRHLFESQWFNMITASPSVHNRPRHLRTLPETLRVPSDSKVGVPLDVTGNLRAEDPLSPGFHHVDCRSSRSTSSLSASSPTEAFRDELSVTSAAAASQLDREGSIIGCHNSGSSFSVSATESYGPPTSFMPAAPLDFRNATSKRQIALPPGKEHCETSAKRDFPNLLRGCGDDVTFTPFRHTMFPIENIQSESSAYQSDFNVPFSYFCDKITRKRTYPGFSRERNQRNVHIQSSSVSYVTDSPGRPWMSNTNMEGSRNPFTESYQVSSSSAFNHPVSSRNDMKFIKPQNSSSYTAGSYSLSGQFPVQLGYSGQDHLQNFGPSPTTAFDLTISVRDDSNFPYTAALPQTNLNMRYIAGNHGSALSSVSNLATVLSSESTVKQMRQDETFESSLHLTTLQPASCLEKVPCPPQIPMAEYQTLPKRSALTTDNSIHGSSREKSFLQYGPPISELQKSICSDTMKNTQQFASSATSKETSPHLKYNDSVFGSTIKESRKQLQYEKPEINGKKKSATLMQLNERSQSLERKNSSKPYTEVDVISETKTATKLLHHGHSSSEYFNIQQESRSGKAPHHSLSDDVSKNNNHASAGAPKRRRRRAIGLICGICGDSARSLHFGGVSCDSCKAFFRRAVIAKAYPSFLCVTTGLPPRTKRLDEISQKQSHRFGTDSEASSTSVDISINAFPPQKHVVHEEASSNLIFNKTLSAIRMEKSANNGANICSDINTSLPKSDIQSRTLESFKSFGRNQEHKVTKEIGQSSEHSAPSSFSSEHSSTIAVTALQKDSQKNSNGASLKTGQKKLTRCPPITITTRKYCQACRFQQCIEIGMEISWVTLENDSQKRSSDDLTRDSTEEDSTDFRRKVSSKTKTEKKKSDYGVDDPNHYLSKAEQREIEDLVDIYRSVFWGVPEPAYHRPALIDFPPPFLTENVASNGAMSQKESSRQSESDVVSISSNHKHRYEKDIGKIDHSTENNTSTQSRCSEKKSADPQNAIETNNFHQFTAPNLPQPGTNQYNEALEKIRSLPEDQRGVNMFRTALIRRPRPWLIRQLMGFTLRFMNVVLKILQKKSLSLSDRITLLRQGMTKLTFMNSVFTFDTNEEGWPERVFPPLPLVLQEGDNGTTSEEPEYLNGITMHADEVASVVEPHVLEHQLLFIRGLKTIVGNDYVSSFLMMAIMLFDPLQEGLEQPQVVENIQAHYCYLLKQYVKWKFRNGSPPNPGNDRPSNFSPTPSKENHDIPESTGSNEPSPHKQNSSSSVYIFERPPGTYFSPPYPPSPVNPDCIFPLLMTRLADLQQIADGYSSTPFMLQGPEVDEIGNLVARIEVFMSDIIATGPVSTERDRDDNGDSGGTGGNTGNPEDNFYNTKENIEENMNKEVWNGSGNSRQPKDGGSYKQKKLENDNMDWIPSGRDMKWDDYSTGDDDSYSGSSFSGVSIGDSFEDIVEALVSEENGKMMPDIDFEDDVILEPYINSWEEDSTKKPIDVHGNEILRIDESKLKLNENHFPQVNALNSELESFNYANGEKASICHQNDSLSNPFYILNPENGETRFWVEKSSACTSPSERSEHNKKVNKNETSFSKLNQDDDHGIFLQGSETPDVIGDRKGKDPSRSYNQDALKETMRTSHSNSPNNLDKSQDPKSIMEANEDSLNGSLWDRIKSTGRALLGLESKDKKHNGWKLKGETTMTYVDDNRDLNYLLDPLERPESNSSGYVSTISSPPPINILKDFDHYSCTTEWEDLLQKL